MSIQTQMRALLERYCTTLTDQVEAIDLMLEIPAGQKDQNSIVQAQALTHQLKGTGGTMGFADVAVAAAELDESLKELVKQGPSVDLTNLQSARGLLAVLQSIARKTTPDQSTLFHADLSKLINP